MPIHDWSKVDAGIFHDFHQAWTIEICNALNVGVLPGDYFAMAEQGIGGPLPDVVTLQRRSTPAEAPHPSGGIAVADAPPQARFITTAQINTYAAKANLVSIRHRLGTVVAVVEIVSPGNKSSSIALRTLVTTDYELLSQGISLLAVDLFPPTRRDPQGIHKAIWDVLCDEPFELPPGKPLTVAAYTGTEPQVACIETVAVGDLLPSLPISLDPSTYVPAPLEATYQATWEKRPAIVRELVAGGGA